MASNLNIVVGTHFVDGSDIYFAVYEGVFRPARYTPYRNAVAEHGGKGPRFTLDEATRFSHEEAEERIAAEMLRRGDQPKHHFWVNDLRIVPLEDFAAK